MGKRFTTAPLPQILSTGTEKRRQEVLILAYQWINGLVDFFFSINPGVAEHMLAFPAKFIGWNPYPQHGQYLEGSQDTTAALVIGLIPFKEAPEGFPLSFTLACLLRHDETTRGRLSAAHEQENLHQPLGQPTHWWTSRPPELGGVNTLIQGTQSLTMKTN